MDAKKVLKPIDEMLVDPWQVDIQELFEAFVNEPDEIKQNLYNSLYTYILQRRQEDIINRPGFVIQPSKSSLRAFYFVLELYVNKLKTAENKK